MAEDEKILNVLDQVRPCGLNCTPWIQRGAAFFFLLPLILMNIGQGTRPKNADDDEAPDGPGGTIKYGVFGYSENIKNGAIIGAVLALLLWIIFRKTLKTSLVLTNYRVIKITRTVAAVLFNGESTYVSFFLDNLVYFEQENERFQNGGCGSKVEKYSRLYLAFHKVRLESVAPLPTAHDTLTFVYNAPVPRELHLVLLQRAVRLLAAVRLLQPLPPHHRGLHLARLVRRGAGRACGLP